MTAITTTHTATVAVPAAIAMEGVPPGYWQDQRGALVPEAKVKDIDKLRHQVVTDLCQMAKASSAMACASSSTARLARWPPWWPPA